MKHIFTSFNKMIYRPLMIAVALLAMSGNAWGGTAKYTVTANSSPSSGGYVMASDNGSASFSGTATSSSKEKTASTGWTGLSAKTITLYVYASAKSGYTFKGWASSAATNTTVSTNNPMSSKSTTLWGNDTDSDTYYAIFAKLTANKSTLSFGSKNTQSGWGNAQKIKVTGVHVGNVTATIGGDHANDFSFSNSSSVKTTQPLTNVTNTETTSSDITIYFNPSCNGTRTATLTFSGNGLTKTVTLTGTGALVDPTFSTTDGSVNVSVGSTATTTRLSDRVTTNSDGTITYTCNNSAVTISNGNFSATRAGEYTVNVSLAASCKYNAKTGSFKITVNRLPASLTATNGATNIYLAGMSTATLDLSSLLTKKVGNAAVKYEVKSANSSFATIANNKDFSATKAGNYSIHASMVETDQYTDASCDFTVTVKKLVPTVEWKEFENIYSGNTLKDVTTITYNGKTVSGLGITLTSQNTDVMTVEGNDLHAQVLTEKQSVQIDATTQGTDYYESVTSHKTYNVEAKQTPIFTLNGKVLVAQDTTIRLKIGEKATMTFNKIDESQLKYPTTSGAAVYAHNTTNHTGEITANYYGNREMVFEQNGTTTIFGQKHNVTVYVDKHPVTLNTTDALNNMTWLVDDVFNGNVYTVNTPASGEPAQNAVDVTSSDETVLKLVDGKWKAIGEGDATLIIAQQNNNYWTGDTITKAIHVSKHTPVITWNAALNSSQPWAKVIDNPVSSTNKELPFKVTSNDKNKADYVNGKIEVYNGTGNVTFTLTQDGNDKWNAITVTKTFSCYKPNDHVPFTLASNNHSNFEVSKSQSYVSWKSTGCDMGETNFWTLTEVRDLNAIYHFTGVPDTLKFERTLDTYAGQLPGTYLCEVYESPDNTANSWELAWQYITRNESSGKQKVALKPTTRYIKFRYNGTLTAHYQNIEVTERQEVKADKEFDFTSGGIGDNPTVRQIPIEWYNVRTCSVAITGTDAKYFKLGEGSETIYSRLDTYNDAEKITVKYLHDEIKKHTATLTITNADGKSATITLKGETTRAAQEIVWNEDLMMDGKLLIAKGTQYDDVATASSGLAVELYVANGDSKLTVLNGESIKGLADGTTKLYAIQAGTANKWAEAKDTIEVQITSKTVQSIDWNDPLSNIKYTGTTKNVTLHASSHEDSSLPITYTLDKDAQTFASVNGNTLTITGVGTGKITAKQAGNGTYVGVSATKTLTSYNPNQNCAQKNISLSSTSFTLYMSETKELEWDEEPEELSFTATVGSGALIVTQWYDNEWHPVAYLSKASKTNYGPYALDRKARKIKFEAGIAVSINVSHTISNINVTKARYLEVAENYMDFSSVQKGQTVKRQFTVNYSDASGVFEVSLEKASDQFQLLSYTLGSGCEDTKENAVIKVNCTGKTVGKETNKIIIKNNSDRLEIPLEAVVTGLTQQIHWDFDETEDIKTTDNIQLSATADSGDPVAFTSGNTSVATVKKVGENYYLNIIKDGEVTITAKQDGNDDWEKAEKQCKFVISKVTPTISQLPTADEVVLPKTLAECDIHDDYQTSVEGAFEWEKPATSIERVNSGYTAIFRPTNTNWYETVTCTIPVTVLKTPQTITWDFNDLTMYCNAEVTFQASAPSSKGVYFTSSNDAIAYVDDNNVLRISQGGKVTITAHSDADDTYADAPTVSKQLNILRVSPTIETYPEADAMRIGTLLSNATIRGGVVKLGNTTVQGSFSWVDGNTTAMNEAGTFQREILFTPTEAGWFEPITGEMLDVTVEKYAPVISEMNLTAEDITYGTTLTGAAGLSGTIVAKDTVKKPNVEVSGSFAWVEREDFYDVHTTTAKVVFIPTNDSWYDNVEFEVPLHVNPAQTTYSATVTLNYGQALKYAVFTNTTKGLLNEDVEGTISWADDVDINRIPLAGTYTDFAVTFTPADGSNYVGGTGTSTLVVEQSGIVFEGAAETNTTVWGNQDNWLDQQMPGEEDFVVVNANVEVTSAVTIAGLTINENQIVTIKDGGSLTLGAESTLFRESYGNIIVEAGGTLNLGTGDFQVNDFTLHASAGDANTPAKSGQVNNQHKLNAAGKVYFVLDLDPSGSTSYGWYDFTVPFEVDALRGITRLEDGVWKPIQNEKNYAIMKYHEDMRARGEYAWKKYTQILQPGTAYTMTTDSTINTYRFEKLAGAAFHAAGEQPLQTTEVAGGDPKNKGWNGVGNGTLTYVRLTDAPLGQVQMYDHTNDAYRVVTTADHNFVVGSAFFVQAESDYLTIVRATSASSYLRAPEQPEQKTDATIVLSHAGSTAEADRLYIAADEDATADYTIGKDLQKMGTMSKSLIARIWTADKGGILCAVNAPMQGNRATVPFKMYLPTAGTYTLSAEGIHADNVYLLRNGQIIWDLAMSEYSVELENGKNTDYSIMLVRQTANVVTGVDEVTNESNDDAKNGTIFVQKMIVNDQLFILRDGILYDAQGRIVRE